MNDIKKCSISGIAFSLEKEAYKALQDYIESLEKSYKSTPDGAEIIQDIEARIAELILSAQNTQQIVGLPLIQNIIAQLGSAEDISEQDGEPHEDKDLKQENTSRIARRLYRNIADAKMGGVFAGLAKYFDTDPTWLRIGYFLPLLLLMFGGLIPLIGWWLSSLGGNLFGIFTICYLILWFTLPVARTARQKLEMEGAPITARTVAEKMSNGIHEGDPDSKAKPVMAETVSLFGKIILVALKIFAGLIVCGLILFACALIIGLFFVIFGRGEGIISSLPFTPWLPIFALLSILTPILLLIYTLMSLVASSKPTRRSISIFLICWIIEIFTLAILTMNNWEQIKTLPHHSNQTQYVSQPAELSIDELKEQIDQYDAEQHDLKFQLQVGNRSFKVESTKTPAPKKAQTKQE